MRVPGPEPHQSRSRAVAVVNGTASGAGILCSELERLGVEHVFALAGTELLALSETLRRSSLRTIRPTHELAAAFMANGYARASGRPGVMAAIPGPGLAYTLAALVEARTDSVPLVCIVPGAMKLTGPSAEGGMLASEACAQVTKARIRNAGFTSLREDVRRAVEVAVGGEPGPVLLEVPGAELVAQGAIPEPTPRGSAPAVPATAVDEILGILAASRRAVLLLGAGVSGRPDCVRALAEALHSPVLTTTTARGVLPESHPLCLARDLGFAPIERVNDLLAAADAVLALGWKGSSNGSGGYRLEVAPDKFLRVDASDRLLREGPAARLKLHADSAAVVSELARQVDRFAGRAHGWDDTDLASRREAMLAGMRSGGAQPVIAGAEPQDFFAALRRVLPADAVVVTDSGLHQMLVRRNFEVNATRGLIVPSDFQSMGFGLPAAIGASLAAPRRRVVAIIGDGGLLMSGMDIVTAVEQQLDLKVVVFCDRRLNLIYRQQVERFGHSNGTELPYVDVRALAEAVGCSYARVGDGGLDAGLRAALLGPGVSLVEVPVAETLQMYKARVTAVARSVVAGARDGSMLKSALARLRGR